MPETHDSVWLGSGIQPSRMFILASATIMVYDYVCTLDQEVKLVWKKRLGSFATILFLMNRYLPYFYVFSAMRDYWSIMGSQTECRRWDIGNAVPLAVGLFLSELILVLRTWAIWNRSRIIFCLFVVMGCAKVPLVLLALYRMLHDSHYINISPTEIICISPVLGSWSWETLTFVVILFVETIIAALTLVKAVQAWQFSSRWYFKILYMGIVYYFYNLLMTIVNLIGTVHLRNMGILSFVVLQGVLQSALCSRVIFLARSPSELGIVSDGTNVMSSMWFGKAIGSRGTETETETDNRIGLRERETLDTQSTF